MADLIPIERIESKILLIRGKKVLLDRDLAELYNICGWACHLIGFGSCEMTA